MLLYYNRMSDVHYNSSRKHNNNFKSKYCTNCGKNGHEYKQCRDPITSIGIILIKFDYLEIKKIFNDLTTNINITDIENNRIEFNDIDDIKLFSVLQNLIKFMIICRKHTLGYSEFIRGRYRPENVDGIVFLFQQMIKEEIQKIDENKNDLASLWDDFWIDPNKKFLFDKDYQKSKTKFDMLKNPEETELTLDFYIKHVVPTWTQPEWGFPKGRRDKAESNLECAMREFEEETGLARSDYILLEGIKPLSEEFIGTNAVRYKHIYYVAYASNDKTPEIDKDNIHQISEIGDIGYYTYNEIMNMIRPYHIERKTLVTKLFMYVCEKIMSELKKTII